MCLLLEQTVLTLFIYYSLQYLTDVYEYFNSKLTDHCKLSVWWQNNMLPQPVLLLYNFKRKTIASDNTLKGVYIAFPL